MPRGTVSTCLWYGNDKENYITCFSKLLYILIVHIPHSASELACFQHFPESSHCSLVQADSRTVAITARCRVFVVPVKYWFSVLVLTLKRNIISNQTRVSFLDFSLSWRSLIFLFCCFRIWPLVPFRFDLLELPDGQVQCVLAKQNYLGNYAGGPVENMWWFCSASGEASSGSAEGPGHKRKGSCKEDESCSLLGNEAPWISYIFLSKIYNTKMATNY